MRTSWFGLMAVVSIAASAAPAASARQAEVAATAAPAAKEDRPKLGISVDGENGVVTIVNVNPGSAAANAGLKVGDQLVAIGDHALTSIDALTDALGAHKSGDTVNLKVKRGGESMDVAVKLVAPTTMMPKKLEVKPDTSARAKPIPPMDDKTDGSKPPIKIVTGDDHGFLGVMLEDNDGVTIGDVLDDGPADKGGLHNGDVVKSINGHAVASTDELREQLANTKAGDEITVVVDRDGEEKTRTIRLGHASEVAQAAGSADSGDAPAPRGNKARGTGQRMRFPAGQGGDAPPKLVPPAKQPSVSAGAGSSDGKGNGWLGVYLQNGEGGIEVQSVVEDGPAAKAGLKEGDVITSAGDHEVADSNELVALVRSHAPGDAIELKVRRGDGEKTMKVELGKNPNPGGMVAAPDAMPRMDTSEPKAPAVTEGARNMAQAMRGASIVLPPNHEMTVKIVPNGDGSYRVEWGDGMKFDVPADGRRVITLQSKGADGVEVRLASPAAAAGGAGRTIRALKPHAPEQKSEDEGGEGHR